MRNSLFIIAAVLLPAFSSADTVGVVTLVEGEAGLIRDTGYFSLEEGVDVDDGDVIETTPGSRTQLEMIDGSLFELGPASKFYLSDYRLRKDKSIASAALSLVRGWLRFATGGIAADDSYQINTTTATIGIRGTEGIVEADDVGSNLLLEKGLIEFFEVDDTGTLGASRLVKAGEFAGREHGKRISHLSSAPAKFRERLPKQFKEKHRRLKGKLKREGVTPRKLRNAEYDDLRPFLTANPRARAKLTERFKSKFKEPKFRERLKKDFPEAKQKRPGKAEKKRSTKDRKESYGPAGKDSDSKREKSKKKGKKQ